MNRFAHLFVRRTANRSAWAHLACLVLGSITGARHARAQDQNVAPASATGNEHAAADSQTANQTANQAVGESLPQPPIQAQGVVAPPESAPVAAAPTTPSPPYRPYSIPFYLRPMPSVNVARLDTVFAPHDAYGPSESGLDLDVVQLATIGVRATDWLMFMARMGWDWTSRPGTVGMSNLVLGANFTTKLQDVFRLSVFVAAGLPSGTDGSASPNHRGARLARLAMDNAMFLTDHASGIVGVGFGFIDAGWTLQADATLLAFGRAESMGDEAIVNSTFGLHVGYFLHRNFSLAGELHHQHFLSNPNALRTDPYGEELRSQTSGTLGARFHIPIGSLWVRPAVSWSVGFDTPMSGDSWQAIQVDIPVLF